jgi:hypothetical protein
VTPPRGCCANRRYDAGSMEEAYALVARMQERGIVLSPYLDQHMLEAIFKVCAACCMNNSHRTVARCEALTTAPAG